MNFINLFKEYLISKNTSKATLKNYLSDIRKFIQWFETRYGVNFLPNKINPEVITEYKKSLIPENIADVNYRTQQSSAFRSVKRYESSLRKFFEYLKMQGVISINPVYSQSSFQNNIQDPWFLKEFKNSLFSSKASDLTIKNYLLDIKQFLMWAQTVTQSENKDFLPSIDSFLLEEYKNRMLNQAKLSPNSINRKLSSLRKYLTWLKNNKLADQDANVSAPLVIESTTVPEKDKAAVNEQREFTLEDLAETVMTPNIESASSSSYSNIPPIRLIQKNILIGNFLIDLLITRPVANAAQQINLLLWKINGEKLFKPIERVISEYNPSINIPDRKTITTNSGSYQSLTDKKNFMLQNFLQFTRKSSQSKIRNIPKEMYAPLKISTKSFPLGKKIIFHLRHTRPLWYRKYHAYPLAQYINFAVFLIFIFLISLSIYTALFVNPQQNKPALASLANGPPRFLSFQGKLTDAENNPITVETPLRFTIYNDPLASGAALLWQEVQQVKPDKNGSFTVTLGKYSPLTQNLYQDNQGLYLGISIGTGNELKPRQQLAMVSYAEEADTLQGLVPITQENAGTSNVLLALDSAGNLTIGGNANPIFQATGGQFTISGQTVNITTNPGSNGDIVLNPDGDGMIDLNKPIRNTSYNNNIPSLSGAVEIDDILAILATSSAESAFTIEQNGIGPLISASSSGIAKFVVDNTGSGTFANNLSINGNSLTSSSSIFNMFDSNVTNLNIGNAATFLTLGSSTGRTIVNNNLEVNGNTIFGSLNYTWPASQSAQDVLQTNGNGNLSWVPISTLTGGSWQEIGGVLAPQPLNSDVLIGSTSTSSATFAFINVNGGTPTEIISNQNSALTLNAQGVIGTTNNQDLTLGNSTTAGIVLNGYAQGIIHSDGSGLLSSGPVNLSSSDVGGVLPVTNGGTGTGTQLAQGSIIFADSSGAYSQNNSSLFWDNINNRLGIGTNTPATMADIRLPGTSSGDTLSIGNTTNGIYGTLGFSQGASSAVYLNADAGEDLSLGANNTEILRITDSGNGSIGVNTIIPEATLDVHNLSLNLPTASFTGDTSSAGVIVDNSGAGNLFTASSSGVTEFTIDNQGNTRVAGSLCVKANTSQSCAGDSPGTIYATNTTIEGADYAENYVSAQMLEPGDVVSLAEDGNSEAVIKATASSSAILGIVSTAPGVIINSGAATDSAHPYIYPIALAGRVPIQVSTTDNPIHAGDPLTASLIPGVAVKQNASGEIVGHALEDAPINTSTSVETIMAFVSLSWYNGSEISDTGDVQIVATSEASIQGPDSNYILVGQNNTLITDIGAFASATIANLQTGILTAKEISANTLNVAENITIGGINLRDYIAQVVSSLTDSTPPNQTIISPIVTSNTLNTNLITSSASNSAIGLQFGQNKLSIVNGSGATASAVASFDNQGNATFSGTLRANTIIANNIEGLHISGATTSATYITNITNIYNNISTPSATASESALSQPLTPTPQVSSSASISALLDNQSMNTNYADISSISGQIASTPTFSSDFGQFNQGLISLGATSLADVSVADQIDMSQNMVINDNSINTLQSDLSLQPLRQEDLSFEGGLATIDTQGNLSVQGDATFAQNLTVKGRLFANSLAPLPNQDLTIQTASGSPILTINQVGDMIASGTGQFAKLAANALNIVRSAQADTSSTDTIATASAGTAIITANETGRTIMTPYVTENSLIYISPTSNTQGVTPYVARQTPTDPDTSSMGSFTIEIPYAVSQDISLNWWIVN